MSGGTMAHDNGDMRQLLTEAERTEVMQRLAALAARVPSRRAADQRTAAPPKATPADHLDVAARLAALKTRVEVATQDERQP